MKAQEVLAWGGVSSEGFILPLFSPALALPLMGHMHVTEFQRKRSFVKPREPNNKNISSVVTDTKRPDG